VSLYVGYFDDSGRKDGPNPIAVVAGFVAHPADWLGFNPRWQKILDKHGIEVHHQNKWSNHAPPFTPDDWPDSRRHEYLNELIDLFTGLNAVPIGAAVQEDRFDALFPEGRKYMSVIGYAAQCVFGATAEVVRSRVPAARIAYVFESGTPEFGAIQQTFNRSIAIPETKQKFGLISLAEGDKRDFRQLQAADIMAYETFKLFEKGDDRGSWNARYPLREIGNRLPVGILMTPSDDMLKYASDIRRWQELQESPESL